MLGEHLASGLHGGELMLRLRNFLKNGALAELAWTGGIDTERCRGIIGGFVLGGGFVELDRALLLRGLHVFEMRGVFGFETLLGFLNLKLRSIVTEGFRCRDFVLRCDGGKDGLSRIHARRATEALRAVAVTITTTTAFIAVAAAIIATASAIAVSAGTRFTT
jgi:hypothetical protein